MEKKKLIAGLLEKIENDLQVLKAAAKAAYTEATHEESKPENQYDTRALEASYLAGAQSKRITDTEELLVLYKHVEPKNFTEKDPISATALVEAEFNGKRNFYFVLSKGGGITVNFEGKKIQVITPSSPVGGAMLGLKVGDTAFIETGGQTLEYDILSIQ